MDKEHYINGDYISDEEKDLTSILIIIIIVYI